VVKITEIVHLSTSVPSAVKAMKYENEKEDKTHTVGNCLNAAMHSCGLIVYYRLFIQKNFTV